MRAARARGPWGHRGVALRRRRWGVVAALLGLVDDCAAEAAVAAWSAMRGAGAGSVAVAVALNAEPVRPVRPSSIATKQHVNLCK